MHQKTTLSWALLEVACFLRSPACPGSSFPFRFSLQFCRFGEKEDWGSQHPGTRAGQLQSFKPQRPRKLLALYFMAERTPLTSRKGKHRVCYFNCNQNHPGVPSQPSGLMLIVGGAAVPLRWPASPVRGHCPMVTWICAKPTSTLRKYWKPKHWQVILQLSHGMCVSFPAFEPSGELLVVFPPSPFSCIVVIGKIWVFFFIITFFFPAGQ